MTDRELMELIWADLDGELSAADRRTLAQGLAEHPEAARLQREARELTAVLSQVEDVEVPADLSVALRHVIHQRANAVTPTPTNISELRLNPENDTHSTSTPSTVSNTQLPMRRSQRVFPIGLAALVLVALGVIFVTNKTSIETSDLQGTIGTAVKYSTDQIAAEDVQLSEDAVQEWMQSDVFDRLARDPQAQAALANDAFRDALANDAFRDALASDAFRQALVSDAFRTALANDAFRDALSNDAFRSALASDAFRAALANDAFRAALSNDAVRAAFANDAFRAALANDALRSALVNDALSSAARVD